MVSKDDKIKEVIKHCKEDMIDLKIVMYRETSNDMMLVWKYQYNLNIEIIRNLGIGNLAVASALMRELSRSIIAATAYQMNCRNLDFNSRRQDNISKEQIIEP
ncbi:MAG: hypothetical protein PHU49_17075 [Syntrophorhabdaceae bacterium]|jgi:hypothetical protein|nr:hypothetical protein [Syntrophorhabdaceae bacterium]